jgi:hypothetical protein
MPSDGDKLGARLVGAKPPRIIADWKHTTSQGGCYADIHDMVKWTDQGIRTGKDAHKRMNAARDLAKKVGVEIKQI